MSVPRLFDEHIPAETTQRLRALGFLVHTVQEGNIRGYEDEDVLRHARKLGCIVVTFNRNDFMEIATRWISKGCAFPGVIIASQERPALLAEKLKCWLTDDIFIGWGNSYTFLPNYPV